MMNAIDNFLNKITMYRLVLYFLTALVGIAVILSAAGVLPYHPLMIILSLGFLVAVSYAANAIFAKVFRAHTNIESFYITAFILALIITPPDSLSDTRYFIFMAWAAVWAMASKFIFAIHKKHVFNPAAFAVVLTALTLHQNASWWVGTTWMMPFVLAGGLLVVRKLRRADLAFTFIGASLAVTLALHAASLAEAPAVLWRALATSPLLFFAFVMFTEPLTTPPTRNLRTAYGILTALVYDPLVHIGGLYSTPELALLAGNVFSYLVSPKKKLLLRLKEKKEIARDTYSFAFASDTAFPFRPGQYLEWTLRRQRPDSRGNRRYFTIASAPEEPGIRLGVKFYPKPSTFKKALLAMRPGDEIVAGQLAGDFTLPRDRAQKLCFIAGGIGITPFESMLGHLLRRGEKRDIAMFYSNRTVEDIAYEDTLDRAERELGVRTVHTVADPVPGWQGESGFLSGDILRKHMPDWRERMYYISGPRSLVAAFEKTLSQMGIHRSRIKVDFFPGFA